MSNVITRQLCDLQLTEFKSFDNWLTPKCLLTNYGFLFDGLIVLFTSSMCKHIDEVNKKLKKENKYKI